MRRCRRRSIGWPWCCINAGKLVCATRTYIPSIYDSDMRIAFESLCLSVVKICPRKELDKSRISKTGSEHCNFCSGMSSYMLVSVHANEANYAHIPSFLLQHTDLRSPLTLPNPLSPHPILNPNAGPQFAISSRQPLLALSLTSSISPSNLALAATSASCTSHLCRQT
jgi:hypothetical protein